MIATLLLGAATTNTLRADINSDFNPIMTAVPALSIAPDARGGGLGDVGAATTADVFSQYWNPAKYAFHYSQAGFAFSYTPWLRRLVSDVGLANASGFWKFGNNDLQAMGASINYFSLGNIQMTNENGDPIHTISPYEMTADLSFSRKLSDSFSAAVAIRYIRSDMGTNTGAEGDRTPGNAFAADIAVYYTDYVIVGQRECQVSFGLNASNIGTKISYDEGNTSQFLPANLKIGGGFFVPFDAYNRLSLNVDLNKYLVPTPPNRNDYAEDPSGWEQALQEYRDISPISGIFKSFTDAPGGFKEEMQEITAGIGLEYSYDDQFFVRGGYHYESMYKGNRQYATLGAGFKMNVFELGVSYLIATVPSNPLDQTLRFSLAFDMDGINTIFAR